MVSRIIRVELQYLLVHLNPHSQNILGFLREATQCSQLTVSGRSTNEVQPRYSRPQENHVLTDSKLVKRDTTRTHREITAPVIQPVNR